jgi:GTP-binding protein EngB required for normal cell division
MSRLLLQLQAVLLLALLFFAAVVKAHQQAYLLVGPSGAGKSTLTNLLTGGFGASPEGNGAHSVTKLPVAFTVQSPCTHSSFCPGTRIIDTPGFWDTGDLSADDIITLVRSELFKHQLSSLAGVLLVLDGAGPRLQLANALQSTLAMLGPGVIPHVTVVITKADSVRPGGVTADEVLKHAQQVFVAAGGEARRVVMIDSKTRPRATTIEALVEASPRGGDGGGYALAGIDDLARKEEQYFADELKANTVTRTEQVPRVETRTVAKTVMANVAFTYECNCQRVCAKRALGICIKRRRVCGSCAGTRQEPRKQSEVVHETVYDAKTITELVNSKEYCRQKAKRRVLDELHRAVFGKRPTTTHQEL